MKKATYSVIIVLVCLVSLVSCKKVYHCSCSYNNVVVLNKDLGAQYAKDAKDECTGYDTTITGEKWTCTLY